MTHNRIKSDDGDRADRQPASTTVALVLLEEDGMDPHAFDRLARMFVTASSRRAALGALLAATGTALGLVGGERAAAQPNCGVNGQDCCKVNGKSCHTGADCCSGRCVRRRGKKVCKQAGNQGWCEIGDDACTGSTFFCGTASDSGDCVCFATTKGHSFCGNNSEIQPGNCDCKSGDECERRLGKGAKCVRVDADCEGACPGATTGCMAPCPDLFPSA